MQHNEIRVYSLASGSSGNAMLFQSNRTSLLMDAGLPLRTLSAHLSRLGVGADDLDAILLTHEHHDHVVGAGALARRTKAPLIANPATLAAYAARDALPFARREMPTGERIEIGPFQIRSFAVPHDAAEAVGYTLEVGAGKIAYFTDAGTVTPPMRDALRDANLAIVEANHDVEWLRRGPYSDEMKARVASDTGHLANEDCAAALAERLQSGQPLCVWLAHLSRVNNSPALARRTVASRIRALTETPFALDVALRDHPSLTWRTGAQPIQLSLL